MGGGRGLGLEGWAADLPGKRPRLRLGLLGEWLEAGHVAGQSPPALLLGCASDLICSPVRSAPSLGEADTLILLPPPSAGNKGEVVLRGPAAHPLAMQEAVMKGIGAPITAMGAAFERHMGALAVQREQEGGQQAAAEGRRLAQETVVEPLSPEASQAVLQRPAPEAPGGGEAGWEVGGREEEGSAAAQPPAQEGAEAPPGLPPRLLGQLREGKAGPSAPGLEAPVPRPSPFVSATGTPTSANSAAAAAAFSGKRHMRRTSMTDRGVIDVVNTQPGTLLVRMTSTGAHGSSGTPTRMSSQRSSFQHRRQGGGAGWGWGGELGWEGCSTG